MKRPTKGLFLHSAIFLVVISMLIAINLKTTPYVMWSLWPAAGWGIGLLFHALGTVWFQQKAE